VPTIFILKYFSTRRNYPSVSLLPPLLVPVALHFLHKQHSLAFGVYALVESDMDENVGLGPVGGGVYRPRNNT
jgi:hypothetical protein